MWGENCIRRLNTLISGLWISGFGVVDLWVWDYGFQVFGWWFSAFLSFQISQQIAFVFNLVCEDKSSVGCGEKIVLGGDEGLSLTAPTDQKLHFLFFYPLFFLLVPNILIPYFSVWKTERQATEGQTDWLTDWWWSLKDSITYRLFLDHGEKGVPLKAKFIFVTWPLRSSCLCI